MNRRSMPIAVLSVLVLASIASLGSTGVSAVAADDFAGATQLIVRLDPMLETIEAVNRIAHTSTAEVSTGVSSSYLLEVAPGADPEAAAASILSLPGVLNVEANATITAPELDLANVYAWNVYAWSTGSPLPAAGRYAAGAVRLQEAQNLSTGAGVVVAVLDTGVQLNPSHAALGGALVPGIDLVDRDWIAAETRNGIDDDGDGLIDEGIGHGTHVAGIVHQVAPQALIMPIRILDDDGTGTIWTASEGMFWAADHGAQVINMSLGVHGSAKVLRDAVATVTARGVLVVAAAGNDGKDRTMFPAAAPGAIAVGSVGPGDAVSPFSNFGRWVDVMAPGEGIHSTYAFPSDSYASNSGTSMATPWVAGGAALVLARTPTLSPAGVTAAITAGAQSVDARNPSRAGLLGAGRLDLAASLQLP